MAEDSATTTELLRMTGTIRELIEINGRTFARIEVGVEDLVIAIDELVEKHHR
jgi:hypothetical protein